MSDCPREVPDEDASPKRHQHYSPMNTKEDSTSQDLSINRKWVKQMKKRIREFVSNSSFSGVGELNHQSSETNLNFSQLSPEFGFERQKMETEKTICNFGLHLEKCETSSISRVST